VSGKFARHSPFNLKAAVGKQLKIPCKGTPGVMINPAEITDREIKKKNLPQLQHVG
jgi:hypothetical protein